MAISTNSVGESEQWPRRSHGAAHAAEAFALTFLVAFLITAPVVAQISTTIDGVKSIPLPLCAENTDPKVLYEEKDRQGNTFQIWCNKQYQAKFIRADGTVAWVGICKFRYGQNVFTKKAAFDITIDVNPDGSLKARQLTKEERDTPREMLITTWKNIKPAGDPPTAGTEGLKGTGEDIVWIYDVKTNKLISRKTKHEGKWVKLPKGHKEEVQQGDPKDPRNWRWVVDTQTFDGPASEPKEAPKDPKLLSLAGDRPVEGLVWHVSATPGKYALYTPVPFTVRVKRSPQTFVARLPVGAETIDLEKIEAAVGRPFTFDIEMPHEAEDLLRYSLVKAPKGMNIEPRTGVIHWTPSPRQAGSHTVVVRFTYDGLTSLEDRFLLTVRAR